MMTLQQKLQLAQQLKKSQAKPMMPNMPMAGQPIPTPVPIPTQPAKKGGMNAGLMAYLAKKKAGK